MINLANKVAVITGGGSGIGLGIAQSLAAEGAKVIIAGRNQEKLKAAAATCSGEHAVQFRALDVTARSDVDEFFAWVESETGPVNILVSSAGTNIPKRRMDVLDPDDWDKLIAINATGAYNAMRCVLPGMKERQDGNIINISSIAGKRAIELGGVAYNASKFAMTALGTTVGEEVRNDRVRVTNIYPGEVETPILDERPEPVSAERRAKMLQPGDVAATVMMVLHLPPRAHVPELVIKPTVQSYV